MFKSRVRGSVANVSRQLIPGFWCRDEPMPRPGELKGTPGDAKCVTEIFGGQK